ncbi:MAG: helix-turn-helix domain-containing protein [Candidatus Cloacimonetes bacterium]|nr:helix-turn-helix domain-containing protein [Candidatus Cloacimonadota bacterium]
MSSSIKLLTTKELMDKLKVKRNTIYQLRKEAELPTIKLGRTIRFDEKAIDAWLQSMSIKGNVDLEEFDRVG